MKRFFATAGFIFLWCAAVSAQTPVQEASKTPSNDQQIFREILAELKQLRTTMAKMNVNQLRFQVVFDQYKLQQNRVDSMTRELEAVRNQVISNNPFRQNSEEMIKVSEERLLQTTDPRQRQNLERQIQQVKRNLESQDQRDKRTKERLTTLEMQLPVEQAKLEQVNIELERIKQDINSMLNQ